MLMWISKEDHKYLTDELTKARRKAKEYDDLLERVSVMENMYQSSVVLDSKCVLLSLSQYCHESAEAEKLKKKVQTLEAEKDWWRLQYAKERCTKDIEGMDLDALNSAIDEFIKNYFQIEEKPSSNVEEGSNATN